MWYFIGWSVFSIFFRVYMGFKVTGRNNVPKKGAFIFASNHSSYLDPIILGTSICRRLNYMARSELFEERFLGWALPRINTFPVSRGKGDLAAIRQALGILDRGLPLVMFPEGTRSEDNMLKKAKPGVGFIAAKSRVPVVPAYIEGSFEALPSTADKIRRYPIRVRIGKPIDLGAKAFDASDRRAYQKVADDIMAAIDKLKGDGEGKIS